MAKMRERYPDKLPKPQTANEIQLELISHLWGRDRREGL